ncbi:MAG: alpha/beta hydrolase [Candidatus Rokuibacteriota bacterium]
MIPERTATIPIGPGLTLEAALALPADATNGAVLCHPHPLYGGDMHNPVVVRTAEVCAEAGLATLRFNFRGVGASSGVWDEGRGEQDDVRAALARLGGLLVAPARVALVGYSFGAAMAAAAAATGAVLAGLALLAPPLALRGLPGFPPPTALDGPLLLLAGSDDEYCPRERLEGLGATLPGAEVRMIAGANHFFFGRLFPLGEAVRAWAARVAR